MDIASTNINGSKSIDFCRTLILGMSYSISKLLDAISRNIYFWRMDHRWICTHMMQLVARINYEIQIYIQFLNLIFITVRLSQKKATKKEIFFWLGSEFLVYLIFPCLLVWKEKMFSEYPTLPNQQVWRISSIIMILDFFYFLYNLFSPLILSYTNFI